MWRLLSTVFKKKKWVMQVWRYFERFRYLSISFNLYQLEFFNEQKTSEKPPHSRTQNSLIELIVWWSVCSLYDYANKFLKQILFNNERITFERICVTGNVGELYIIFLTMYFFHYFFYMQNSIYHDWFKAPPLFYSSSEL